MQQKRLPDDSQSEGLGYVATRPDEIAFGDFHRVAMSNMISREYVKVYFAHTHIVNMGHDQLLSTLHQRD
jgi:hypothetical protein